LRLAIPALIAITITFGYVLVNIAYAGRLGDPHALAGIGLSNVLINGLWFTTFNGFSGALQTMVSQASSLKDYSTCNNTLRAAMVVLVILYIPLALILYSIDLIMGDSMLNADPESVKYAVTYTRTIMTGFFFEAIYDLEKKYLLQFNNAFFPMLIQFVTLPLHIVFVSSLYDWAPNSLLGIAMATNISFFLNFIVLHIYLTYVT
jgi:Na+-driven multidrug efflux pump